MMYSFQADVGGVSLKTALPRPPQAIRAGPVLHHGVHAPLVCRDAGWCVLCWMALHCVLLHACMCMSTLCCVCMCVHVYSFFVMHVVFFLLWFFFFALSVSGLAGPPLRSADQGGMSRRPLPSAAAVAQGPGAHPGGGGRAAGHAGEGRPQGGGPAAAAERAGLPRRQRREGSWRGRRVPVFFVALPVPPVSSYFWV